MKLNYIALSLWIFLAPVFSLAQLSGIQKSELPYLNILQNPGFELGKKYWSASGGTFNHVTSNVSGYLLAFGGSVTWDSSAASQNLYSELVPIPEGLKGKPGLVKCLIKTPSGTATHNIVANDGTTDIVTAAIQSTSSASESWAIFTFPSSGSMRLGLRSVASNEPLIAVDSCWLGETYNLTADGGTITISTGSQYWTGYHDTDCAWSNTGTTLDDPTADTSCTLVSTAGVGSELSVTTTGNVLPGLSILSGRSGRYRLCASFSMVATGAGMTPTYQIVDDSGGILGGGTTTINTINFFATFSACGHVTLTSGTSRVVKIQTATNGGTPVIKANGTGLSKAINWSIEAIDQQFPVPRFIAEEPRIRALVNFSNSTTTADVTGTYSRSGTTVTVTVTNHNFQAGHLAYLDFTSGLATDGSFEVTGVTDANTFTVTHGASGTTSGNVTVKRRPMNYQYNVAHVTNIANVTGQFAINFSTPMPDTFYAVDGLAAGTASGQTTFSSGAYLSLGENSTGLKTGYVFLKNLTEGGDSQVSLAMQSPVVTVKVTK